MNTKFAFGNLPSNTSISINLPHVYDGKLVSGNEKSLDKIEDLPNPHRWYGNNWIVMQNKFVYAIASLTLEERRIMLYLSRIVRLAIAKDPTQRFFEFDIREFCKSYELEFNDKYFFSVAKSCKSLQGKTFEYWTFDKNEKDGRAEGSVNFLSDSHRFPRQGRIRVEVPSNMILMLTLFSEEKEERYTKYEWDLIVKLSKYGLILLELIYSFIRYKSSEEFTVEFIRAKFDYAINKPTAELNRSIIDKAIKDVNNLTDVEVSYTTECRLGGRTITHYIFRAISKPNERLIEKRAKSNDETKPIIKKKVKPLSEKQIRKLATRKQDFVNVNTHMNDDKSLGYYDIFEKFKPLLQSEDTVNQFNFISEFLAMNEKSELPEEIRQYKPSAIKRVKIEKGIDKPKETFLKPDSDKNKLTMDEIDFILEMPDFCTIFHGGLFGNQIKGSKEHKDFLRFWLQTHLSDFMTKPAFYGYFQQAKTNKK